MFNVEITTLFQKIGIIIKYMNFLGISPKKSIMRSSTEKLGQILLSLRAWTKIQ